MEERGEDAEVDYFQVSVYKMGECNGQWWRDKRIKAVLSELPVLVDK